VSIAKPVVPSKELFLQSLVCWLDARPGHGDLVCLSSKNLTNLLVFGVRLRSASKGANVGAGYSGAPYHRSKRDDGTDWY
jgi:hypothetical protein